MTEARQKAEEKVKEIRKRIMLEMGMKTGMNALSIQEHMDMARRLYEMCVAREQELEKYRSTVAWIASQQNLFFAECSQAEEIIARCKECLGALPGAPKEGR